ncbi:MAG: transcriptional regulator, TetR family [Paenibacillaceae bacterium]|nr:transcriptional regulator, TetR family [Paenibacillaceae bacterium]
MEKFVGLPVDKQNKIIAGALTAFGANGYKKASVSDIAAAAGISKAMVFHYFGTKKTLYLHLMDFCSGVLMNEVEERFDQGVTDFFERIKLATIIKISVMEKHPSVLSFLTSAYFEEDEEVRKEIKHRLAAGENFRSKIAFDNMDASKFKEGVDPKLVMKILVRYAEGFVSELPNRAEFDMKVISEEFDESMNLLRNNLYKEEYLGEF